MPGATAHAIRRALSRAGDGKALTVDETAVLLAARGGDLRHLTAIASSLRDLGWGDTVTYSRKVFVPLTMLCRDHCHYCTFAKPPAKLDRPFLTPEEAVEMHHDLGGRLMIPIHWGTFDLAMHSYREPADREADIGGEQEQA